MPAARGQISRKARQEAASEDWGHSPCWRQPASTQTRHHKQHHSSFYVDAPAAEHVVRRARALRERTGTLTGHALGEDPEPADVGGSLLADILAVVPADQAKVWNQTVVAGLAELRPDRYGGWEPEQLTAALKPHGVSVGQVWGTDPVTGEGANRRGITRAQVIEAAERAHRQPPDPPPG